MNTGTRSVVLVGDGGVTSECFGLSVTETVATNGDPRLEYRATGCVAAGMANPLKVVGGTTVGESNRAWAHAQLDAFLDSRTGGKP